MDSGEGDWPAGLHTHLAGPTEGGGWIVIEVWESQEDQDAFMQSRLGGALHNAGVTRPPKRQEWSQAAVAPLPEEGLRQGQVTGLVDPGALARAATLLPGGGPMLRSRLRGTFAHPTNHHGEGWPMAVSTRGTNRRQRGRAPSHHAAARQRRRSPPRRARTNGCTASTRAAPRCATCWAARARASPR